MHVPGGACPSTGVIVDQTPPEAGTVYVVHFDAHAEMATPPTLLYQYSVNAIRIVARNFSDAESGLEAYYVEVKRTDGWLLALETNVEVRRRRQHARRAPPRRPPARTATHAPPRLCSSTTTSLSRWCPS